MDLETNPYNNRVFLFDKPLDWTSFQLVKKVRWLTKTKKVGHAGTLDPRATGLLILCTGKKTKTISEIQGQIKTYTGIFKIGYETASFDRESEEKEINSKMKITMEKIDKCLQSYIGEIEQVPPIFSAVKIDGKRAYKMAREGQEVKLRSKHVTVHSFEIEHEKENFYSFKIVCSKGTYIRSLARDLGRSLGCGAYLWSLRRTKIGDYSVEDAIDIKEFEKTIIGKQR